MIYTDIYPGWNYPGGPVQPFCSYDPLCAHFQSTKPSSQPKTVPYKMQWLLLFSCGKEHAFCSSPTFELFRGRNAFCSGVFWGSKFITRCARPHFIALGRWLMEFFSRSTVFFISCFRQCHVMSATPQSHFVDTLLDEETRAPDSDHHFVVDHYHLYFVLSLSCFHQCQLVSMSVI